MNNVPLIDSDKNGSKLFSRLAFLLAASLVVICLVIANTVYSIRSYKELTHGRKDTVVDRIIRNLIGNASDYALPTKFGVQESYILPPTDQMRRGSCWIFATTFLLESQYRHQGIKSNLLNKTKYVSFSKQAYGAYIGQHCIKNPTIPACQHGGLPMNITDDHKIDSLYYFNQAFPDFHKALLPESVCPYTPETSPETDFSCPGMEEAIKKNPIEYKIKSIEAASDVKSAKKLLIKAQRPLGIGLPLSKLRYYSPCNGTGYETHEQCINKVNKCPTGFPDEYCAILDVEGRAPDGTFVFLDDYAKVLHWGGHAMNIVGYNDDWVYRARHASTKTLSTLKGGFILHNSWRAQGHSVDYLLGRRSEENEAVSCPNHRISSNWIPAKLSCITENKGDHTKCGTEIKKVRGKGITQHSDLLKCTNAQFCDVNRKYVLAQAPKTPGGPDVHTNPLFNGMDLVELISWTNENDIRSETLDTYPFQYLHQIFTPVDVVENSYNDCGYYMVPYSAVEMQKRKAWSLLDTFHVVDIDVEFTSSSYVNASNPKYDYELLKQSTHDFDTIPFDGPLPYDYVY